MNAKPSRGRPRKYDPDLALSAMLDVFWKSGYSATSLDMLSAAANMNRPSLYAAFGDKQSIYLKALGRFQDRMKAELGGILDREGPVATAIGDYLSHAIDLYIADPADPKGCFTVCTAAAEAPLNPEIRAALAETLEGIDAAIEARLRRAREEGELTATDDPAALAPLVGAVLHSLAVRARAGTERDHLRSMVTTAVAHLIR